MRRTLAVARKDLVALWTSPVPWVVAALVQSLLGLLYLSQLEIRRQAVIQPLFPLLGFLLMIAVPVLAMRSFAEEARAETLDLLEAIPVPAGVLVAGKWFAVWGSGLLVAMPALVHAALLGWLGEPDRGPIVAGFIGLALLIATLTGIGVLASTLSASQPVAAVVAFVSSLVLWFAHVGSESLVTGGLLAHFSLSERLRGFASGAFDTADAGWFAIATLGALVMATTRLDLRRLR
ncbi:MAG TPA: hypothetical protein VMY34_10545 [Acidimicrobiales bacterium]|nr:hypothetical protein [Acidimicrobiales bacterium]